MDWFVLGIEPTKDKNAITAAYRQKLRTTNPEDKPEEFKALRTAYEEALAFADREETEPARDESPVGLWIEAVAKLYEDYPSRLDPANWEALMAQDVCVGLDTRALAEEALLKFLMERYYLPKNVWKVLDATFDFSQRVEELYETWPREFIDYAVLSGIRLDPALPYELFTPGVNGADCDTYRQLYSQANQMPLEELGPILEKMEALSEQHPYGQAVGYRFAMENGQEQAGKEGFCRLAKAYPEDALLVVTWASICLEDGNVEEAEALAVHILDNEPKHISAKSVYAKCLAAKGAYHQAKEHGYEIMHLGGDNPLLMEQMAEQIKIWNGELIRQREEKYAQEPQDWDNAIELAWCYIQNERAEDAHALAQKIDPNYEDAFAYHNLMGKLYHNAQSFADALEHMQAVETILRNMEEDGTEKTHKRLIRLPEMLQIQGNCLMQLGRPEEAKEKFKQALELAPEDTEILSLMGRILFASGEYDHAIEVFQQLLAVSSGSWFAELMTAMSLYRLRRDREAFDAINRAMSLQSNDLSMYLLKLQILVRNKAFEEVHQMLNFLKESGAPEDIALDFIRAELTHMEKQDAKGALKQYRALEKRMDAGEPLFFAADLYYHLAVLTGNQMNVSLERNRKTVLEIADKGLEADPQNTDLLHYKAWVLKQGGLQEEAVAMYRQLEEKNPSSAVALRGLADLYYEDINRYAAEALSYYEKLLELQKTAELYFFAATCKRYLGDFEGARQYYLKNLEMDQEDIDGYRGLAFIYDIRGEYEKSLEMLDQALGIMEAYQQKYDWLVEHKVKVLRRLGRTEQALAFLEEAAKRYQFGNAFQLRFDICCQFGLWEQAREVLAQWKRANRNDPELMAATGRFHLLRGEMFKSVFAMGRAKRMLPFEKTQDYRLQLADLESNHQRKVQIWSRRVNQNPEDDYAMLNLAHAYWHLGNLDVARGAARKALSLLDEILTQAMTDEPLYRSRRSLALAILGREEEAREELEKTRKLPLCEFCEYGSCKDADVFEAYVEEILGNRDTAQKLYTAGKTKWPDELDFVSGELRLQKKGRK